MWLFAKNGFLTFVQHDNRPDLLLVRGRIKGDIENYFPNARVTYRTDRDYAYRTMLPKTRVAERIASAVSAIDYVKYKPSVQDKRRRQAYITVWDTMYGLQEQLAEHANGDR